MSDPNTDPTFVDISDLIDQLLDDPIVSPGVAQVRAAMRKADKQESGGAS
jgi:hypothetical protein